jgi:REP element-mobilizing transposase RayT
MFSVSKDNNAYYLTSVAKNRLPIFQTATIAQITCSAIDEARRSGGFLIFAYVIMPHHLHLVTNSHRSSQDIHRYVNGIISRRVLDHLKAPGREQSLNKLRIQEHADGWKYSLWQHHPDTRLLWSEQMLWQRIQYTHLNPVRAVLVAHPNDWRWSSARIFHGRPLDDEPLRVDLDKIIWRRCEA